MAKNNKQRSPKTNKPKITLKEKKAAKKAKNGRLPAIVTPKP